VLCSMILVNVTAPIEDIGPVNGFGNMLAAGMRALGPALAGQLWALSLALVDRGAQFVAFGVVPQPSSQLVFCTGACASKRNLS